MRAALICLPAPGEMSVAQIAGRSAASCQLELALNSGCELVVTYGHGASTEAISLRHRAEAAGARFVTVNDPSALIGAIGINDSLLVLQPGLWPEAAQVVEALRSAACILVLPAGMGVEEGFERIDLDRAWAGVLVMPGHCLDTLKALTGDVALAPALLRVALQHGLPATRIAADLLGNGSWCLLRSVEAARQCEKERLSRFVGSASGCGYSAWLARLALQAQGAALASHQHGLLFLAAALVALLAGSLVAALQGYATLGLALLGVGAFVAELTIGLARVRAVPFGQDGHWPHLRHLLTAVLAWNAICAPGGTWLTALFAAAVFVAALLLLDKIELANTSAALRDRGLVAAVLAVSMQFMPQQTAIMLAAATLLGANLIFQHRFRG